MKIEITKEQCDMIAECVKSRIESVKCAQKYYEGLAAEKSNEVKECNNLLVAINRADIHPDNNEEEE